MHKNPKVSDLPKKPAIYALYGGKDPRKYVAYVGSTDNLQERVNHHLILRNTSVTTGTKAASLDPDYVTGIKWWECKDFSDEDYREAAEIVAFKILDPTLRSRGNHSTESKELENNADFRKKIQLLLDQKPSGEREFPDFQDLLDKLNEMENEIKSLKNRIEK